MFGRTREVQWGFQPHRPPRSQASRRQSSRHISGTTGREAQKAIPKALTVAPFACRAVAAEVVLMHHRGCGDAHGRPRAQDHAAEAHEAKQAFDTARHGEATDEAVRSRLKRAYRSAHLRAFRVPSGGC